MNNDGLHPSLSDLICGKTSFDFVSIICVSQRPIACVIFFIVSLVFNRKRMYNSGAFSNSLGEVIV
jgi:hypothetical protein